MRRLSILFSAAALAVAALLPTTASAAFPGANGLIAFVSREADAGGVIAVMSPDGVGVTLLTNPSQHISEYGDGNPAWSPGGTLIVFARYDTEGYGDLWTMNANGTGQKRLTNSFGIDDDYAGFSADGSRIVFASDRAGNYEIYSMALNGTDVRRLTNHAADDWLPAWSPNNDRIAFASDRRIGGQFDIWTMKSDGSDLQRETTGVQFGDFDPAWSPDGTAIYFTRYPDATNGYVMRVTVATNATTNLTPGGGLHEFPAVPPDPGSTVYDFIYSAYDNFYERWDTYLVGASQAAFRIPVDYEHGAYQADWQPIPAFPLVDARFSNFEADIVWAYDNDITTGCSAERFCPDNPVTREQMASFLVRALDLPPTATDYFTDDEGSSHEDNINRLRAAGITTGCTATTFCPTAVVKRDQMASFISRGFDLPATGTDYFTDDEGNTHEANINRLRAAGITTGCTATTYCPSGVVTRGQMAAFLHRAVE